MIRPVDAAISQHFGDNPTRDLPADSWLIQTFGNYQPDGHTGEDYAVPVGTPIRAVTSGTVLHVGYYAGSYADNPEWISPNFAGWCYVINHDPAPGFPNGFIGIYAHGQDGGNRVTVGQRVTEGQVIGLSGNTGGSTGPHLHFEILPDGWVTNSYMFGRVDPEQLFAGGIAAMGTITSQQGFLMALTDAEQAEALDLLRNLTGYLYKGGPSVKAGEGDPASLFGRLITTQAQGRDVQLALTTALPALLRKDGAVNIRELAAAIAGQLAAADVAALAAQLQITVKAGN